MWWLIPVLGLLLGTYFGQFLNIEIPAWMVKYFSIGIMAALDSVFGGVKAMYERKYDSLLMLTGFFANALLAGILAYIGDMLSIDLYYAAVFAFGVRLFSNLSLIRVYMIEDMRRKRKLFRERMDAEDEMAYYDRDAEDEMAYYDRDAEDDIEEDGIGVHGDAESGEDVYDDAGDAEDHGAYQDVDELANL